MKIEEEIRTALKEEAASVRGSSEAFDRLVGAHPRERTEQTSRRVAAAVLAGLIALAGFAFAYVALGGAPAVRDQAGGAATPPNAGVIETSRDGTRMTLRAGQQVEDGIRFRVSSAIALHTAEFDPALHQIRHQAKSGAPLVAVAPTVRFTLEGSFRTVHGMMMEGPIVDPSASGKSLGREVFDRRNVQGSVSFVAHPVRGTNALLLWGRYAAGDTFGFVFGLHTEPSVGVAPTSVAVLNATKTPNLASDASRALADQGFSVAMPSDSPTRLDDSRVYFRAGSRSDAVRIGDGVFPRSPFQLLRWDPSEPLLRHIEDVDVAVFIGKSAVPSGG